LDKFLNALNDTSSFVRLISEVENTILIAELFRKIIYLSDLINTHNIDDLVKILNNIKKDSNSKENQ
jgi:hypothetical protein